MAVLREMFASSSPTHLNVVYSNVNNANFLIISSIHARSDTAVLTSSSKHRLDL